MNDAENVDKVEHKGQSRRLRPFGESGGAAAGFNTRTLSLVC